MSLTLSAGLQHQPCLREDKMQVKKSNNPQIYMKLLFIWNYSSY